MIKIKKGLSAHVEMILSFIVFISFVLFIFIIFRPLKVFPRSTSNLDLVSSKITDSIKTDLALVSLKLDDSFGSADYCVQIDYKIDSEINKSIVKDGNNVQTRAKNQADKKFRFECTGGGNVFYRIFSSKELDEWVLPALDPCTLLTEDNYTLGLTRFYKKVSKTELDKLFVKYDTNYFGLKGELGIESNFNLLLLDGSGKVLERHERTRPQSTEVAAKNIPIEVLNESADLTTYLLNVQVWD